MNETERDARGERDAYGELVRQFTDERLAMDLERLADNVQFYGTRQREAILLEASRRLNGVPR